MKNNLGSSFLLMLALGALGYSIAENPPGGARWGMFVEEPVTLFRKFIFLAVTYVWPGVLSCFAVSLFQLQFRLASSGANKRTVFAVCVLASGLMLVSLRTIAFSPTSGPSYVAGMALGYTMMSRLYAIKMRRFFDRVNVPWPIWRGNVRAVQEMDQMVRTRLQKAA